MSGPGIFPKENSQILYAEDVNLLYGNFIGMRSTEAETAVNVAKLQYCASVTDIDHDYMVVDVFTDSTGYNNTIVELCLDPQAWSVTGTQTCCVETEATGSDTATSSFGNYYSCTSTNSAAPLTGGQCALACSVTCINTNDLDPTASDVYCFCFNVCCTLTSGISDTSTAYPYACYTISGSHDDNSLACCVSTGCCANNFSSAILNCYNYVRKTGTNYYNFYKNDSFICQVDLTSGFPNIILNNYSCARCICSYSTTRVEMVNLCVYDYTCGSTSTYNSSGLNGYYSNVDTTYPIGEEYYCCAPCNSGNVCVGNFYVCNYSTQSGGSGTGFCRTYGGCVNTIYSINNAKLVKFCVNCCLSAVGVNKGSCTIYNVNGSHDDFSCCINANTSVNVTNCYCYICTSTTNYDFYKNGVCQCSVAMTEFPTIDVCIFGCFISGTVCQQGRSAGGWYEILDYQISDETKVSVCETQYDSPVSTVYLSNEEFNNNVVGSGTVVYNVINATDDSCIACNVPINCLYNLSCCVQCHKYEIIQCSDGVSCIKSYALLAGVY